MHSTIQIAATGPLLPGEPTVRYVAGATVQAALGGAVYTIPGTPLTGAELLAHASRYPAELPTKADLVAASGYVGQGCPAYYDFYSALIAAQNKATPYIDIDPGAENTDVHDSYDALSEEAQALYDQIDSRFGEKWTHEETVEFMGELDDIGIETAETLQDVFVDVVDNDWRWEKEFAEEYVNSLEYGLSDSLVYSSIDWQDVWDSLLQYDFDWVEYGGLVYIFRK